MARHFRELVSRGEMLAGMTTATTAVKLTAGRRRRHRRRNSCHWSRRPQLMPTVMTLWFAIAPVRFGDYGLILRHALPQLPTLMRPRHPAPRPRTSAPAVAARLRPPR